MADNEINWNAAAGRAADATLGMIDKVLEERQCLPLLESQRRVLAAALIECSAQSIQWAAQIAAQGEDITPAASPETWAAARKAKHPCHLCHEELLDSPFNYMGKEICTHCAKRMLNK